jgi:hypothetical protein
MQKTTCFLDVRMKENISKTFRNMGSKILTVIY